MPNLNPEMPQQPAQGAGGSHTGLIIAIVAVIVLLVAGGAYYWMFWQNAATPDVTPPPQAQNESVRAADATSAIDADLNATEDVDLDTEFKDIDADLQTL